MITASKILKIFNESSVRVWYDSRNDSTVWELSNSLAQSQALELLKKFASQYSSYIDRVYALTGNKVAVQFNSQSSRDSNFTSMISKMADFMSKKRVYLSE